MMNRNETPHPPGVIVSVIVDNRVKANITVRPCPIMLFFGLLCYSLNPQFCPHYRKLENIRVENIS